MNGNPFLRKSGTRAIIFGLSPKFVSKSMIKKAILVSITSGIGEALAERLLKNDWHLSGTTRNPALNSKRNFPDLVFVAKCNLDFPDEIDQACEEIISRLEDWDALVLCAGSMEPIGAFNEIDYNDWEKSFRANFFGQLRFVRNLLKFKSTRHKLGPSIIFFAGGGSNGAPLNYSAYTISKIALTKMCELLDAENKDCRFTIIGPGWVDTKIHQETLRAGIAAGTSLEKTKEMLANGKWVPMDNVLDCIEWVLESPKSIVGGRNFSVANDQWQSDDLANKIIDDENMYKLRRFRNEG
jgi:NAD(P)-dependent dehydrogenase (short-subunit alcohol dehydrogenase family)